jgi:aldehyde dehydrogenase family 7 protein A1
MWKGGESAGLTTIAVSKLVAKVFADHKVPQGVFTAFMGDGATIGEKMINDQRINLISFTGSTAVGRHVAKTVAGRFGKCLLELGGNNCSIIMEDADIEMAVKGCIFGAVGTAGQRCTTLRRLAIHESKYREVVDMLCSAYPNLPMGDPLVDGTLMGPLHNQKAVQAYLQTIETAKAQGGKVLYGGKTVDLHGGNFVLPTIVEIDPYAPIGKKYYFSKQISPAGNIRSNFVRFPSERFHRGCENQQHGATRSELFNLHQEFGVRLCLDWAKRQ